MMSAFRDPTYECSVHWFNWWKVWPSHRRRTLAEFMDGGFLQEEHTFRWGPVQVRWVTFENTRG